LEKEGSGTVRSNPEGEHIQAFFAIALALVLATTAHAQNKELGIGAPVTCALKGYGSTALIITRLEVSRGTADIKGILPDGTPWPVEANRRWKFTDGTLLYERPYKTKYRLVVKDNELKGSYANACQ
jgi:hypothetical protein